MVSCDTVTLPVTCATQLSESHVSPNWNTTSRDVFLVPHVVLGTAKVITYDDITPAEQRRSAKVKGKQQKKAVKRNSSREIQHEGRTTELQEGEEEIQRIGLQEWYDVFSGSEATFG